jgi:hypothetical protein
MKGAPQFRCWPDSVSGIWKQQLLVWLSEQIGAKVLVETGTCEGATPLAVHNSFDEIHTIELHPGLLRIAHGWLDEFKNVFIYEGSSPEVLPGIISNLKEQPIVFWLDAHTSGPHTAQDNPLPRELAVIMELCPDALMVIDDQAEFDLWQFEFAGWHAEYRTGEIILHKEGRYVIPPFEE